MVATTSEGSIVLHPQNSIPIQQGQITNNVGQQISGMVQPVSVRTLQNIKMIPIATQIHPNPGNNQRVGAPMIATQLAAASQNGTVQQPHQQPFMARIISTRPGQLQGTIPNAGCFQQVILAPPQSVPTVSKSNQTLNQVQNVNQVRVQNVNQIQNANQTSFQTRKGTPSPHNNPVKNNTQ